MLHNHIAPVLTVEQPYYTTCLCGRYPATCALGSYDQHLITCATICTCVPPSVYVTNILSRVPGEWVSNTQRTPPCVCVTITQRCTTICGCGQHLVTRATICMRDRHPVTCAVTSLCDKHLVMRTTHLCAPTQTSSCCVHHPDQAL